MLDSNINFITFVARYAYAVASALNGVGNILHKDFMIQVWQVFHAHYGIFKIYSLTN